VSWNKAKNWITGINVKSIRSDNFSFNAQGTDQEVNDASVTEHISVQRHQTVVGIECKTIVKNDCAPIQGIAFILANVGPMII
jgi:hypothetical protein